MEPLFHFLVPLLILIALFPKINKKKAILFALLTFIPDLDMFILNFHRILFHNIFFIILISLIFYFTIKKQAMLLSFYFLISHMILDLSYKGIALFYPLIQKSIFLDVNINAIQFIPKLQIDYGTLPLSVLQSSNASYYLTTQGFLILILLMSLLIIKYKNKLQFLVKSE